MWRGSDRGMSLDLWWLGEHWTAELDSTSAEDSLLLLRELILSAFDDHDQPPT
jgi:hypothetical protein